MTSNGKTNVMFIVLSTFFGQIGKHRRALVIISLPALILGGYVLSVCWRVSIAEHDEFGRSTLLPVTFKTPPAYNELPVAQSYGSGTYTFIRKDGKQIKVHKQLINGFQHSYGSALADFELGPLLADYLFRANEYAESYVFCRDTDTEKYSLDTRKDLANNKIGRAIGEAARTKNLTGQEAYRYMLSKTLDAVDSEVVLPHLYDPRVAKLPPESKMGCPGLRSEKGHD